jgi:hypothetical protein
MDIVVMSLLISKSVTKVLNEASIGAEQYEHFSDSSITAFKFSGKRFSASGFSLQINFENHID